MYRPSFPEAPMMQTFMSADYLTPRPLPGAPPNRGPRTRVPARHAGSGRSALHAGGAAGRSRHRPSQVSLQPGRRVLRWQGLGSDADLKVLLGGLARSDGAKPRNGRDPWSGPAVHEAGPI